jgi:putative amide transporter protein
VGNIGLLFVGVVLLVNGLVTLDVVPPRSAALLNIFVGTMQVVLPTIILIQQGSDPAVLNSVWPTYLFGVTYLYYGLGIYLNLEPEGLGWFSAFVAVLAVYHGVLAVSSDPVFAVVWFTWAAMWTLFFLLMALGKSGLTRFTGWFLVWLGIPTCTVTALFLFKGHWATSTTAGWAALGGLVALTAVSLAFTRSGVARATAPGTARATYADQPVAV